MNTAKVNMAQIDAAMATVQSAIEAGRNGTDVPLTKGGVLYHILNDLDIQIDLSGDN